MPNLRTYRTHRISDIILITIESTAQRSTDSPISWDKNLIPPAQTHGRICSSPHQPSHATRNLTTSTCLEEPLRTPQVCHNAHVVELECLAFEITLVEALAEPNGLLVRGLGRDWQILTGYGSVIAKRENVLHHGAGGGLGRFTVLRPCGDISVELDTKTVVYNEYNDSTYFIVLLDYPIFVARSLCSLSLNDLR